MTRHVVSKQLVLAAMVVSIGAVGGTAYASWTSSGAGRGAATTGTAVSLILSPGSPTAGLYPGSHADVVLSVANPNTFAVYVGSFALATAQGSGGFAVDAGHSGCAVAALSFATQTDGGAGWTVPGKVGNTNGTLAVSLTNALTMSLGAANACQGATTTVYLTAGP